MVAPVSLVRHLAEAEFVASRFGLGQSRDVFRQARDVVNEAPSVDVPPGSFRIGVILLVGAFVKDRGGQKTNHGDGFTAPPASLWRGDEIGFRRLEVVLRFRDI